MLPKRALHNQPSPTTHLSPSRRHPQGAVLSQQLEPLMLQRVN